MCFVCFPAEVEPREAHPFAGDHHLKRIGLEGPLEQSLLGFHHLDEYAQLIIGEVSPGQVDGELVGLLDSVALVAAVFQMFQQLPHRRIIHALGNAELAAAVQDAIPDLIVAGGVHHVPREGVQGVCDIVSQFLALLGVDLVGDDHPHKRTSILIASIILGSPVLQSA
ncbi:hypothetical protein SDC9_187282 [bioreactor metagenome]|uniref:Uncharacterized protein n=1 Tax=bioreactor metagenome TaxID=1076179 RepID=A0A645HWP1_9ZZZZ